MMEKRVKTMKKVFLCILPFALVCFFLSQNFIKSPNQSQFVETTNDLGTVEGWEFNTSRDASNYVLSDNSTILKPKHFCESSVFLLIIVCSAPGNILNRNAIRDSWGSQQNVSGNLISVYFLMGDSYNNTLQQDIMEEHDKYNDIIQDHFIDSYNNLTLKSIVMLKLVSAYCMHSTIFVMKTDDDMFLNMPPLIRMLKHSNTSSILVGSLICGAKPIKDTTNKWYTPSYMYNGRVYPNYLSGTGYVMSIDVVPKLYDAALQTPIFHLEDIYITGVRKCGTRALLEMLYLHPMVQKAAGEVHFFDRDENYNRGLDWYRMKMPHSYSGQITIEKSPSYFVTPEVPERVRAMNASVKLLLIVREPVTRAISDYTQLRAHAATSSPAATPIPLTRSFEQLALHQNGSINEAYRPLSISIYHNYVYRWLETFGREQILVVNGDLLIEDPVPQLQKIERFLGLDPRITTHNFYFNETKGFYCLRNETSDRCLRETKGRRHPRVDPNVVSKLRKYFAEHNQKFYELIGEDLGWPEE